MNSPTISAQQLAALADGRLSPSDRATLLMQLAARPEDVELLADALHAIRDVSPDTDSAVQLLEQPSYTFWRRRRFAIMAIAAVALLSVSIPTWRRSRESRAQQSSAQLVASLGDLQPSLLISWQSNPWVATRGSGLITTAARVRDIRLGALLVNVEVALRQQPNDVRVAAARLIAALSDVLAADLVVKQYQSIIDQADGPALSLRSQAAQARQALLELVGSDDLPLGEWLQAARLAAALKSQTFFATPSTRIALQHLAEKIPPSSAQQQQLSAVRQALVMPTPDWAQAEKSLTDLLSALSSG